MKYLIEMRFRFVPLSWSGGKWNTSLNEAQVYTHILIGRKMKYLFEWGSGLYPYPDWAENEIPLWMRLRFVPLSWLGGKWNTSLNEAQVYTLILIGWKMKYLFEWGSGLYPYPDWAENEIPLWMRLRFVPLSWLGGKWNTSLNEAQVCTLILIGRKMKYLFEWGSGLYPYPDWAENEIPLWMRLRFVPLSWLGGKWNTSLNEAQVCTLILIGRKMKYLFEWGSGLYPYPDWAENEIPLWMRLRFVPLSWLGGKWKESSKEEALMEPSDFAQ